MGSRIYLTNIDSDVSGYKLALVDMRNPNLPTTVSTAVTNATSSGTSIAQTLTPAGTTAKWITRKIAAAVTIGGAASANERVMFNVWAKEDAAATNATVQFKLAQYTTSEQTAFLTEAYASSGVTTELTTTSVPNTWVSSIPSSWTSTVAFAATNRLVILPFILNVGTMAAGSVTMAYDGPAYSNGDTYVEIPEVLTLSQAQVGSATTPGKRGVGVSYFQNVVTTLQEADPGAGTASGTTTGGWLSDDTTVAAAIQEATNQRSLV